MIREETNQTSQHLSQWADILMMMFGYSNLPSLNALVEMYQQFREHRAELSDALVVLVGVVGEICTSLCTVYCTCIQVNCLWSRVFVIYMLWINNQKNYSLNFGGCLLPTDLSLVHIFLFALRCDRKCIWNDLDVRSYAEIEVFSIPASRMRVQIISYALPVATQHKQKGVNQALL